MYIHIYTHTHTSVCVTCPAICNWLSCNYTPNCIWHIFCWSSLSLCWRSRRIWVMSMRPILSFVVCIYKITYIQSRHIWVISICKSHDIHTLAKTHTHLERDAHRPIKYTHQYQRHKHACQRSDSTTYTHTHTHTRAHAHAHTHTSNTHTHTYQ